MQDLKNAHTVQLFDYLETPSDIFLVMEYCNGGDLGDYLIGTLGYIRASLSEYGTLGTTS